jgi:hypothetical protein
MADQLRVMPHQTQIVGSVIVGNACQSTVSELAAATCRNVDSEHDINRRPLSRGICVSLNFR